MPVHSNINIRWYVAEYGIACHAKSASVANECAPLDSTAICTTGWTELIAGLKSGQFTMDLMADFAAGALDERMFAALGTQNVAQSMVFGQNAAPAVGSPGYVWRSLSTSYTPIQGQVGEIAGAALSGVSSGVIARGQALALDTATVNSSGTGAAVEVGALSASQSMLVGLHVTSVSGTTPTLAVAIQSDDASGFPSPTSRLTLSTATPTANRWQVGVISGAVTDNWWRVSHTLGGSTPVFGYTVVVGIYNT